MALDSSTGVIPLIIQNLLFYSGWSIPIDWSDWSECTVSCGQQYRSYPPYDTEFVVLQWMEYSYRLVRLESVYGQLWTTVQELSPL